VNYGAIAWALAPEAILALTALAVLGMDAALARRWSVPVRWRAAVAAGVAGCLGALVWMAAADPPGRLAGGMLVLDDASRFVCQALAVLTMASLVLSIETALTEHIGEYVALMLLATVGLMLMAGAENMVLVYASLELASLSLYALAAFQRESRHGLEAALKYFLLGGMSSAFLLYGMSALYGLSGEVELSRMAPKLARLGMDPLLIVALASVVVGLGFKVAVVPFHLWAPDVYQAAPLPTAALVASGSKMASFYLLIRFMLEGFPELAGRADWRGWEGGWMPLLGMAAALSIGLGNLVALVQSSVRRLLAYSAIAHAGYALLGVMAGNAEGTAAVVYYLSTYALAVIGAFGVTGIVERNSGGDRLENFAGLWQRSPLLAACLFVFILSLAGLPPLAGFVGKFAVFAAAAGAGGGGLGLIWLIAWALGMSAVSLYYYLQVLKQAYVREAEAGRGSSAAWRVLPATRVVLLGLAVAVVLLGCFPGGVLSWLRAALGS